MSEPRLLTAWGGAKPGRSARERYGFAVLAALTGVAGDLLLSIAISEVPLYAILVGVVVVSVAYGGLGPGLVTAAVAWTIGLWLLVEPRGHLRVESTDQLTRWAAALVVALLLVLLMELMRREREQAATDAVSAQATIRGLSALQDLAAACSAALTQADVARALVERLPQLLGARGGALALVDGDDLVVVDPGTDAVQTHRPGTRIPLAARAPIARAASSGELVTVRSSAVLESSFPDAIRLTSYARSGVAAPLRVGGEVVGSISFLYDDEDAMLDDAETLARIAADLGGQALERAGFYERESESRQALDRILRMSPTFHAGSAEAVTRAVCREARMAFGADLGMVWRLHHEGHGLELLRTDPVLEALEPGLVATLDDFPDLLDAVGNLQVSFVEDVQREASGEGLERVRSLGLRSSLRLPVVVGGRAEHLITISWETAVTEPDPATTLLARRFADQAGLAFEQLERRRAEAEATTYADETRRLQEVTNALSLAASASDVGDVCLAHALSAVAADAGFVLVSRGPGPAEVVSSAGYTDEELAAWAGHDLGADVPASRTFASGHPVWALTTEEMDAFADVARGADEGWVALPLRASGGVRGVLQLSFRRGRQLSEGEQRWLLAVVSQSAQALERSLLFDEEQRLRERSERLQAMTAALSNAVTRVDVAEVAVEAVIGALDADGATLALVQEERGLLRTLASRGHDDAASGLGLETDLAANLPGPNAVRRRVPDFFASREELREAFPGLPATEIARGESLFFVPLVAGGRPNGLLTLSWAEARTLSADERRFALLVAANAAQALDRAGTFEAEQTIAATLQRSVLPSTLPRVEGVHIAARYLPGTLDLNVGGDWFDAISLSDGRLGIVVGDVVGKGVQAAATMAQLRNGLRAFSLDRMKPSSTVARLDRLAGEVLETAFATVLYAVVDPQALVCRYTSAGHPPAVVAHADGRVEFLEGGRGLPLGTGVAGTYSQDVVQLTAGSVLVLYTDGLVERRGASIDEGLERLLAAIADGPRDPEPLLEHVLERIVGDVERDDDIAVLAARVFAVAPRPLELRLPGRIGSLDVVRDALRAWLEGTPADRAESEQIVLAVWETCANAVEHGHADDGRELGVRATLVDGRVEVVVEDEGEWKEPAAVPDRGLGLKLIRSVASSVDVAVGATGTRVTIEKALAGDGAGEPSAAD
ncbi:MAG TPA: SpoIIE family protein phosphatase [Gaiellaceae bacterium]|nr:SpoIIE family protein phosphatase [Gaiellaceae bacterium]